VIFFFQLKKEKRLSWGHKQFFEYPVIRLPQKTASDQKGVGRYYPFGLTMAGISDKAVRQDYAENKYRYNDGTELQNKEFSDGTGLELYETPFRSFDPQLGVFHQPDQLADITEDYSPYSFALDNPISYNDAWGLAPSDTTAKPAPTTSPNTDDVPLMPEAVVTATRKDCVTCDDPSVNAPPPPATGSAVASGPTESNLPAVALTVTSLGAETAEGTGITITTAGAEIFWPLAVVAGSAYLDKYSRPLSLPQLTMPQTLALRQDATRRFDARPFIYGYAAQPWGEQYTLRARADGEYPLYEWGKGEIGTTHLNRGDIWKIGTTINGSARYSESFYRTTGAGLTYTPEFFGPVDQLLFVERMKLLNYAIQNGGALPPGNTKLQ
jgi:RHS repeat-associated protein